MANLIWADYVGIAAGAVGTATGLCGAILGYISYRRSDQIKSLDLRIELKKGLNEAHGAFAEAAEMIDESNRSRIAVSTAMSNSRSGSMVKWNQAIEADKAKLQKIRSSLPEKNGNFEGASVEQLEQEIVSVHHSQSALSRLVSKYRDELMRDDEARKFIRDQAHARASRNT